MCTSETRGSENEFENLLADRKNGGSPQEKEEAYCFLTEKEPIWGEMLADVLKQNGVPFVIQKALGGGLRDRVGPLLERYSFYVPPEYSEQAKKLAGELFSGENGE